MYDRKLVAHLEEIFQNDLKESTQVDMDYFEKQTKWKKFRQGFSRMFSPVL